MKKLTISIMLILCLLSAGCTNEIKETTSDNKGVIEVNEIKEDTSVTEETLLSEQDTETSEIRFIDDSGKEIVLDKPVETIISLYSVHTENLYSLGLDEEILGVGTSDKYPEEVLSKTQYSYKDDPELVIAANPDVVLIRSMVANRFPDYVKAIEDAGILVVNLYVSDFDHFDEYMEKLGMLTGKDKEAEDLLETFHQSINEIAINASKIETPKTAYFESIGSKFKTATPSSFAGKSLQLVGLENIASNVAYDGTTTVVTYGEEQLLAKANDIDVYIAQLGTMNKTVSIQEIKERPGFDQIKAIKEDQIIIIDEKLISGATMRYLEGLEELQTKIYGNQLSNDNKKVNK